MSLINKTPASGISQNEARFKQARYSLLLIMIFSLINIFTMSFGNSYFLFSSYFTTLISSIGSLLAYETGLQLYLYVSIALAAISIVPYLLCWIFSKKHYGWMIAGLVLISADTAFLAYDCILFLAEGFYSDALSYVIDLAFHAYMIYSLAVGVKFGKLLAAEKNDQGSAPEDTHDDLLSDASGDLSFGDEGMGDVTRTITVSRPKKFTGCAVALICRIDGVAVCQIKNGQTESFTVNGNSHSLTVLNPATSIESDPVTIPSGYAPLSYALEFKSSMTIVTVNIREIKQSFEQ